MMAVFGVVAFVGALCLLFGGNTRYSGRLRPGRDPDDELLTGFRFAGTFYVRLGQVLVVVGFVGMACSAIFTLVA